MNGADKPWKVVFVAKLLVLTLVVIAGLAGNFRFSQVRSLYKGWQNTEDGKGVNPFAAWDGAYYVLLSEQGYQVDSPSCAFYPLWPITIRGGALLTGDRPLLAGLIIANGLSLAAFWLFYNLVKRRQGAQVGRDALILLLAFPGALFFSFPYTESLYLALVLVLFWALESDQVLWAALTAFLLPLCRPVGVFIALPLTCHLWGKRETGGVSNYSGDSSVVSGKTHEFSRRWLLLFCPLLGYATYFGLMHALTGNALEGFEAQKSYPNSPSIRNIFNYTGLASAVINVRTFDGMTDGMLDRVLFFLFLALLPLIYRLNKTWFFYTLPCGLMPALTNWFVSYRRYFIVLFPVFVVLAKLLQKTERRWIFWYYIVLMAGTQAWAVWRFVTFKWAG